MGSRYWKRDEKTGKLVEFFPNKVNFADGPVNNHINMRNTWSGTTKIEFSETTVEDSINEMNKRK